LHYRCPPWPERAKLRSVRRASALVVSSDQDVRDRPDHPTG
jgi:hypothetical protein